MLSNLVNITAIGDLWEYSQIVLDTAPQSTTDGHIRQMAESLVTFERKPEGRYLIAGWQRQSSDVGGISSAFESWVSARPLRLRELMAQRLPI